MSPGARASGQTLNTQLTLLHRVEGELRYRSLLSTLIWAGNNTDADIFTTIGSQETLSGVLALKALPFDPHISIMWVNIAVST